MYIPEAVGRLNSIIYLILPGLLSVGIYYAINYKIINELLSDKLKTKK